MGWGKRRTPIARWTILCWTSPTRFPNALVWVSDNGDNNSTTKLNNKRASLCNTYSGGVPLENGLWAINEVACSSLTRSLAAKCISQGLYWKFWKTEFDLRLGKYHKQPMRTPSKTTKLPKAWLNASEQVLIGFSFASDWLRQWREFSRPITELSKSKTKAKKEVKPALWPSGPSRWSSFRFSSKIRQGVLLLPAGWDASLYQVFQAFYQAFLAVLWFLFEEKKTATTEYIALSFPLFGSLAASSYLGL